MAISDNRQRSMPTMRDRETGQILAYPEAVLLTQPTNPEFRGEVGTSFSVNVCFVLFAASVWLFLYFVCYMDFVVPNARE